jgi:hypothetical protein
MSAIVLLLHHIGAAVSDGAYWALAYAMGAAPAVMLAVLLIAPLLAPLVPASPLSFIRRTVSVARRGFTTA